MKHAIVADVDRKHAQTLAEFTEFVRTRRIVDDDIVEQIVRYNSSHKADIEAALKHFGFEV